MERYILNMDMRLIQWYNVFGNCAAFAVVSWVEQGGLWCLSWKFPLAIVPSAKVAEFCSPLAVSKCMGMV